MQPIKAPLNLGQTGSEVANLQELLMYFIRVNRIVVSDNGIVNDLADEYIKQLFGEATATAVRLYQSQHELSQNSIPTVDDATIFSINALLDQLQQTTVTLSGSVQLPANTRVVFPFTVTLYQKGLDDIQPIATITSNDGLYQFIFPSADAAAGKEKGYQVTAVDASGIVYNSPVTYLKGIVLHLDIIPEVETVATVSEYEEVNSAVIAHLQGRPLASVDLNDSGLVKFLSAEAAEPEGNVVTLIRAAKLAELLSLPDTGALYGLLRQGISDVPQVLVAQPADVFRRALTIATATDVIPSMTDGEIDVFITALFNAITAYISNNAQGTIADQSATFRILQAVFNYSTDTKINVAERPEKATDFMSRYFETNGTATPEFWDGISGDPEFIPYINDLKAAIALSILCGNNPALVYRLLHIIKNEPLSADPILNIPAQDLLKPETLTALSVDSWEKVVRNARANDAVSFAYPEYVADDTPDVQARAYAEKLYQIVTHSYPTHTVAARVTTDDVTPFQQLRQGLQSFMQQNPDFDFRKTATVNMLADENSYDFSGVADVNGFVAELGSVQRLMNLTPDYDHIAAMADCGYSSSLQIVQTAQADFVSAVSSSIDTSTAASLYRSANLTAVYSTNIIMEQYQGYVYSTLIPRVVDVDYFQPNSAYAEWRSLFGSLDGCNCCSCQSVYSPSAYMTDLLRFMKTLPNGTDVHDELVNQRRMDLPHIELTCKNANTAVPQIDIANELLEDMVSTGQYQMYARQTVADAATQRAIPEHVNTDGVTLNVWNPSASAYTSTVSLITPYTKLRTAQYPWSLPYNFYKRQVDEHLKLTGVKGYEVYQRLGGKDRLAAWDDYAFCTEYLGISQEIANFITTVPTALPNNTELLPFYGFKYSGSTIAAIPDPANRSSYLSGTITPSNWIGILTGRVDVFLQQTGLTYTELLQLLDCYFINPLTALGATTRKMVIIKNSSTVADDTCNLNELKIDGMDANVLRLLYRFVRIQRVLGWTYYELDRALLAMGITNTYTLAPNNLNQTDFKHLAQFKYVISTLKTGVEEATILRIDIDERPYRNYDKSEPADIPNLYERIFRNPALFDVKPASYPFKANAASNVAVPRDVLQNYLSGIFNVPGARMNVLLDTLFPAATSIVPDIPLLSSIYREVLLLKSLKLSVEDWLLFKKWLTNTGSFGADGTEQYDKHVDFTLFYPQQMIRLITFVQNMQQGGLTGADVDYLLQDAVGDTIADDQLNDTLTKMLTTLRSSMRQKWSPVYNASNDAEGKQLLNYLSGVADAEKAKKLVDIIQGIAATQPDYTVNAAKAVVNTDFAFLLPAGSDAVLIDTVATTPGIFLAAAVDRRDYVFSWLNTYMRQYVLEPFAVNFFSKEFKVVESMIHTLLQDCIQFSVTTPGAPANGLQAMSHPDFVGDNSVIDRWTGSTTFFAKPLKALILLHKAALLITHISMSSADVDYFWKQGIFSDALKLSDLPLRVSPAVLPAAAPFRKLGVLLRWMKLSTFLGDDSAILYEDLKSLIASAPATVPASLLSTIAAVFKTAPADISTLLGDGGITSSGAFNVSLVSGYEQPQLYLRIIDALEMQHLLPASMAALAKVALALSTASGQQDANEIIRIVKSQYDDKQWLDVIKPVNDVLRIERRDAMVAYLIANPPAAYTNSWRTINDLFETLMLDVEISPCMSTTRVLMGINTIQLWIDRVLLGLEKRLVSGTLLRLDKDSKRQWDSWRKRYRVWEANRKIFIYPENWIEPELRDGKTPLFVELEKFLKQHEVTEENVEAAYTTYLERLDELAHLDIVGIYRETNQTNYSSFVYDADVTKRDTIHAFGRTPAHPHIFYYRKRVAEEWTPWEKMDVQIDGDHFVPTMWRGRLRLYWLTFMKEQVSDTASKLRNSKADFVTPPSTRYKINLAWTEYKNDRWTAKQVSKDALYSFPIEEENLASWDQLYYFHQRGWAQKEARAWYPVGTIDRQHKERFYFFSTFDSEGNVRFEVHEKIVRNSCPSLDNRLYGGGDGFTPLVKGQDQYLPQRILEIDSSESHNDMFPINAGSFTAKFNGVVTANTPYPGVSLYLPFFGNAARYDTRSLEGNNYIGRYTDYRYDHSPSSGYAHFPDGSIQLLNYAPDTRSGELNDKYLVFPRQVPANYYPVAPVQIPYFFYKDFKNTFFVEKILEEASFTAWTPVLESPVTWNVSMEPARGFSLDNTLSFSAASGTDANAMVVLGTNWGSSSIDSGVSIAVANRYYNTRYRFHNFRHERVNAFRKVLHEQGLDGLLSRSFINGLNSSDDMRFRSRYRPTWNVVTGTYDELLPSNSVDFRYEAAFSAYNWELFFHIPMLIANRLSQNQQFEAARKWYHYVFNPTVSVAAGSTSAPSTNVADFWNVEDFYQAANSVPTILQIMQNANLANAVARWAADPFKPHLVARTRITAYMKNVVMKYLDNLIAWGDALFRTDNRENIVEATLLYVLASQLLGRKPVSIPARAKPQAQTYAMMVAANNWNAFSNALVKIESLLLPSGVKPTPSLLPANATMYYFCIPPNEKLTAYWDIIADRLFKIHNCKTIDGITRDLALYDPPIDPALLVKAAASGVSIADAVAGLSAPLPVYRFNVLSQKATELAAEVKALGSQLLGALEKKDAEQIALLRSSQEIKVLDAVTAIKEQTIEETVSQINGLQQQQIMTTQRRDHYKGLIDNGLIKEEQLQLDSMKLNIPLQIAEGSANALAAILHLIPNLMLGPLSFGAQYGGGNIGNGIALGADAVRVAAGINSTVGSMAATKGGYARRSQDWELQVKLAETELKQIDKQIIGAQIRKAIAEVELQNHKLQIQNAREMDDAMHNKYTNEELYDWMIGQISYSYFAAYKLAYDMARKAERCYQYELGLPLESFIGFEYWDSLRKGLLAGEQLVYDIKRMEAAYLEKNKRQLELTRHISLASLAPEALVALKTNKECTISIPEWFYDLDYPGQHMRRIKSVSISIPCVAGPYTTVSCKLSLLKSQYRKYGDFIDDYEHGPFEYFYGNIQSIATSHAQNDSGMFDFSFRDDRYLPFEGAGAISEWKIELPAVYAQFNYDSISDVILHVNYTARDEGSLKPYAITHAKDKMNEYAEATDGFYRIFDLRCEFPNEWNELIYGSSKQMVLKDLKQRLSYLVQPLSADTTSIDFLIERPATLANHLTVSIGDGTTQDNINPGAAMAVDNTATPNKWWKFAGSQALDLSSDWTLSIDDNGNPLAEADVRNIYLVLRYTATP
jgi:hypothetical protein